MKAKTRGIAVPEIAKRHEALLVLDIDEVVLEFIRPFQTLLGEHGARIHFDSYKLTGNARSLSTGEALGGGELETVMRRLYGEQKDRQGPVTGVHEALASLEEFADIVFLTAMEPDYYEARRETLDALGLPYPMIATERSKGAVVVELAQRWSGPLVFVDDLPPNLETVRRSVPDAHLIHLMAHDGFRPHLPALPMGAVAAPDWEGATSIIRGILDRAEETGSTARPLAARG